MAKGKDLSQLRAQARSRHRAVTNKISRLKSVTGAQVSGTSFDPRSQRSNISRYTEKQLRAYIDRMNSFMSRGNQFVPDSRRRPIPAAKWRQYKDAERRYNAKVAKQFSSVADIPLPNSDMTIRQRMEATTPKFQYMQDRAVNTPYTPINRGPQSIRDEKALRKLTKEMRDRLKPSNERRLLSSARKSFNDMAELIGDKDLMKQVRELSDDQFSVMWNYTGFADALSLGYEGAKALLSGREQAWMGDVSATSLSVAKQMASWAKNVDLG